VTVAQQTANDSNDGNMSIELSRWSDIRSLNVVIIALSQVIVSIKCQTEIDISCAKLSHKTTVSSPREHQKFLVVISRQYFVS